MKYTEVQIAEAMELHPALWVLKHQIKTSNGLPFEFTDHRFMWDFLNDMSPLQVLLKPPQIGASESEIVKTFWVAMKLRKDIIYTLPTQSDVNDMAGGKVNRIVAQNPVIANWVKDHDSVEQKGVGSNIIYYRGTFSAKQAMMVSSDLNVHDEVDASDAEVITQYETRLQAKAGGWRWYFSHPSIAGLGVDVYWQQSDKKEWFVRCPACKSEQILEWPLSMDIENRRYKCQKCNETISNENRRMGFWRKTAQGPFSGWHISQMMCPWISAGAIIDARNDPQKDEQYFWNYVLGLPYVGSDNKIEPSIILRNVVAETNPQEGQIVIGVDTGLPVHYVMMSKDGVFFARRCEQVSASYDPYDELGRLMDRFPKAIIVADQGGDLIGIRKLQAKHPGRVFLCWYRKDRKGKELIKWGEGKELGSVVADRNRVIQLVVEQMREPGRFRLNGTEEDWKPLANHFGNIYRVVKETPFGNEYVWERSGPDHFVHALCYAVIGFDRFQESEAKIVGAAGLLDGIPVGRIFTE